MHKISNVSMCPIQDDTQIWKPGKLSILQGRGRKKILCHCVKKVATAVARGSSRFLNINMGLSDVSRVCQIPLYRKLYRVFCFITPTKWSLCTYCKTGTQRYVKHLSFNYLPGWWLTSIDNGTICGVMKLTFASKDKITTTTVKYGQGKHSCYSKISLAFGESNSILWIYGLYYNWIEFF